METTDHVDYSTLRQRFADQKQLEQEEEEGGFIQVTLKIPPSTVKELKVCPCAVDIDTCIGDHSVQAGWCGS
jgi:hypothetical protein